MTSHTDSLPWLDDDGEPIDEFPIRELPEHLPNMLTWLDEPGARKGDRYVFRFARVQGTILDPEFPDHHGRVYAGTYPDIYIELTAHPIRHKKGHWQAPFVLHGFDRTVYLAPGAGVTSNPRAAIDSEVPAESVTVTPDHDNQADAFRRPKRENERHGRDPNRATRNRNLREAA